MRDLGTALAFPWLKQAKKNATIANIQMNRRTKFDFDN
jgi:hypothetical protein